MIRLRILSSAILSLCILHCLHAAPQIPVPLFGKPAPPPGTFVPIIQQHFDSSPDGSYDFGYQSADGSARQETGSLKNLNIPEVQPIISVKGSYTHPFPEGQQNEVEYLADENGFQPRGNNIHPDIVKAVELQVAEAKKQPPAPPSPSNGLVPFPNPLGFALPFSPTPAPFIQK